MTDILTEEAAIRARYQTTRDTSGQFIRPDKALEIRAAALRMKARLLRDVKAEEHARGVVWEDGHFHKLPGYVPPVDEGEGDLGPVTLFDRRIAA